MKILVVDDDPFVLETVARNLRADGYDVFTASDGLKAVDLLESKSFDLVISDIMMPNLSGLGLLNILKKHYFNKTPVILISSLEKGEIILSALGMGADDFILKPVNFSELNIRVKKILQGKSSIIINEKHYE